MGTQNNQEQIIKKLKIENKKLKLENSSIKAENSRLKRCVECYYNSMLGDNYGEYIR